APARPDLHGVRAAQVPGSAPGQGLHPGDPAQPGVGLRVLRRRPHGRRAHPPPAGQARRGDRGAHPDRALGRLPLRPVALVRLTGRSPAPTMLRFLRRQPLALVAFAALVVALVLTVLDQHAAVAVLAVAVLVMVIAVTARDMVRDLMAGHWGLDVLAVVAMVATLLVGEYLAGLIIALMLTGGEALEDYAAHRASSELDVLLERAPLFARRLDPDSSEVERIPVEDVAVGDLLVVGSSEVVPVDGTLVSARAVIDESDR